MKKLGKKGISTVFSSILFIILVLGLAVTLFPSIYKYNYAVQEAHKVEDERMQEKIVLCSLTTDNSSETEYVSMIFVNNTGTITSRIRAIYIDNEFLCDPSDPDINPDDTYITPQRSKWILLPSSNSTLLEFDPAAKLTVATERGIKSSEYEGVLKWGQPPAYAGWRWNLGPLMLDFNKFYYTNATTDGSYNQQWYDGWLVEIGTGHIVWNITVTNIDNRNITINRYSGFCLFPNVNPQNRRAWYLELPTFTKLIMPNETVNLVYIWDKPMSTRSQDIYNTICRCKVFLTFFGIFHELDGTTKPYAQTIPFEAVRCIPPRLQITAWPTIIPTKSTYNSTITAVVNLDGYPMPDANVTFTTDIGILSSPWAITDPDGIATVTLYPSASPGTATVTAEWEGLPESTTVTFAEGVLEISASPSTISANSTMTSTITAVVNLGGHPMPDANVTFTTDIGILSSPWAITDPDGIATVTLYPSASPGTATVTAEWEGRSQSTTVIFNAIPVASFTESAEIVDTGEVISFNAGGSYDPDGTIVSYFWDFGDGTNGIGVAVDHSYDDNGTYTVTLTVTDDDGATASDNANKTVLNRYPTAFFTESAETVLTGETIQFDASGSNDPDGAIVNYFWDFGDGTTTTGVTASHSYADDGIYTVTLTVTDDDGLADSTNATKTVLNRPPLASFTENATNVLTGEVIHFDATASYDQDGSITSYLWDFGDGTNGIGVAVDHSYDDNGTYTVTLTVTDDDGATASDNASETVLNRPPVANFTESAEIVDTGEVISFNAGGSYDPDGTIVSYFWDFGDGTNATGVTVQHAYANEGVYTVTLTVTDDDGVTASTTAIKTVLIGGT